MDAQAFIDFVTDYGPKSRSGARDPDAMEKLHDEREELALAAAAGDLLGMLAEIADVAWYTAKLLFADVMDGVMDEDDAFAVLDLVCGAYGVSREIAYQCMTIKYRQRLDTQTKDDTTERELLADAMILQLPLDTRLIEHLTPAEGDWLRTIQARARLSHQAWPLLLPQLLFIVDNAAEDTADGEVVFTVNGLTLSILGWVDGQLADLWHNQLLSDQLTGAALGVTERLVAHLSAETPLTMLTGAELAPILSACIRKEAADGLA